MEKIKDLIPLRNDSLIKEINKYREEGRKVFVIAGASHLLEFPKPWKSCKEVQEVLRQQKFIVIVNENNFTKKIAELNSNFEFKNLNLARPKS